MNEYIEMIDRFSCDFELELEEPAKYNISELIKTGDKKLLKDIELLKKLSFMLRNNKVKIMEVK